MALDDAGRRHALPALLLALAALAAACGRAGAPAPPAEAAPAAAPPAPGATPPPPDQGGQRAALQRAEDLAVSLYGALSSGDPGPLEARLDPGGCEVMVDSGQPGQEPFYALVRKGGEADWSALLRWADSHPAETIADVTAAVSPHDPQYILVTVRLSGGYAYFLLRGGQTVTKVFAQPNPADWD